MRKREVRQEAPDPNLKFLSDWSKELDFIFSMRPGESPKLSSGAKDALDVLTRKLPENDLKTALCDYNRIFQSREITAGDIASCAEARIRLSVLVAGNQEELDPYLLRELVKAYDLRISKVNNVIRVTDGSVHTDDYGKDEITLSLEKDHAILNCLTEKRKELTERIEALPPAEKEPEDSDEEEKTEPKKRFLRSKPANAAAKAETISSLFQRRARVQEQQEALMEAEKEKSKTACREIAYYEPNLRFLEKLPCKDLHAYELYESANGKIYFGFADHTDGSRYDNSDHSLWELTAATGDFVQFMTTDLLSGEYDLSELSDAEQTAMIRYFNFVSYIFETTIGVRTTVSEYLDFKRYYNRLLMQIFDAIRNRQELYYKALVLADHYSLYMDCYDLSVTAEKEDVIQMIEERNVSSLIEDLNLIAENHMVDTEAKENLLFLIHRLSVFPEEAIKKEVPEPSDEESLSAGSSVSVDSEAKPVLERQKEPVVTEASSDAELFYRSMDDSLSGPFVVQILDRNGNIEDAAEYHPNNLRQAAFDYDHIYGKNKRFGRRLPDGQLVVLREQCI